MEGATDTKGSGTAGYGGAVPARAGIVVDFHRLNRIIDINRETKTTTVESGVVWNELETELRSCGLALRLYPGSGTSATVGGWIANAVVNNLMDKMSKVISTPGDQWGKGTVDAYFGMTALRSALEAAGSTDPDKLRQAFAQLKVPAAQSPYYTPPGGSIYWDEQGIIRGAERVALQWQVSGTNASQGVVWPSEASTGAKVFLAAGK